jgi:hypothetical protein
MSENESEDPQTQAMRKQAEIIAEAVAKATGTFEEPELSAEDAAYHRQMQQLSVQMNTLQKLWIERCMEEADERMALQRSMDALNTRLVVATEKMADALEKLSSAILTVYDQRGNDYKAVVTTRID